VRVGLIVYGGLEPVSGGFLYDRMLVEHLLNQSDQVEVIALPWRPYLFNFADNLSKAVIERLAAAKLDVLLEDELNHPSLCWLNRRLRRCFKYPIIAIVHHLRCCEARSSWQDDLYRWVERQYLRSVDGFVFNSHTTRSVVESLIGPIRSSIIAYPAGDRLISTFTPEQIRTRARVEGPLRICFAGNLIPRKGLDTLITSLARSITRDLDLRVAGSPTADPAYTARICRQIARCGLADRVRILGSLDANSLAKLFSRSHVLAVPSSYEGFGIVYVEGMAFGLPAIGTTAGAASEIISHGENGFLIDPGDSAALADCLTILHQDRERLATMGIAARDHFEQHPTWQESMASIRRYLQSIVGAE